ncbi:MAG: YbaB/EbfC family nucleoid-associated protein [Dehalococcoidia bacterium]|nr:YbaB/EbfC family nucleoid-associated protein [Dehalococcoidia bacterium]
MKWKQPQPKGNRNLLKQAQQIQSQIAKAQEEMDIAKVESSAGGGAVKVIATGKQTIDSITIDPSVIDAEDIDLLQDLIMTAVNDALEKSKALVNERMGAITGGLGLPGIL